MVTTCFDSLCNTGYALQQNLLSSFCRLQELRNDADFFQKINQIAVASLKTLTIYDAAVGNHFGKLTATFTATAGMHDFYRFMQYPHALCCPVKASKIDEYEVFISLKEELEKGNQPLTPEQEEVLEGVIEDQLEGMQKIGVAYGERSKLVQALEKRLKAVAEEHFGRPEAAITLSELQDESQTEKWIKKASWIEKIESINWTAVDALSAAWWLNEWNLASFENVASCVGQYSALLGSISLDKWLIGGVCTGFAWKLTESIRSLVADDLTRTERSQKRWDVATSITEFVFYAALFTDLVKPTVVSTLTIQLLALTAKSVGVLSIIYAPKRVYFEPVAA